jgi:hypothetical protein
MSYRRSAWEGYLCGRSDAETLVRAIADIDPLGPAPATEADPDRPLPVVMRAASEIRPMDVEWLWRDRLPLGMLSLFAGDPKLGKSFVTIAVAAAVSRGAALPLDDRHVEPGSVILISAEDDPARTIVPRLKAAGASLSKVHILEGVILEDGTEALPRLRADIERIGAAAASLGDCRLIVIDPVSAYLGGVDDHRNAELRGVLSPLKKLAERLNIAVVLVTHLNKGASVNGKHRVTGSIAYVGACRANFLFARDREDPTGRRVLLLDNGCNLAASVSTLAYRIEDRGDGPAVEWESEPVPITAEDALRAESEDRRDRSEASERSEAGAWLKEVLAAGPVPAMEIEASGRNVGFSLKTLKRAKQDVGVESSRQGFGKDAVWSWRLPDASTD